MASCCIIWQCMICGEKVIADKLSKDNAIKIVNEHNATVMVFQNEELSRLLEQHGYNSDNDDYKLTFENHELCLFEIMEKTQDKEYWNILCAISLSDYVVGKTN